MSQQNNNEKRKRGFSKTLLIQESALIWIVTLVFLYLAYFCIVNNYVGSLPFLTAMVAFPYSCYGVSQAIYYVKSKAENTQGGLVYEKAMQEAQQDMPREMQSSLSEMKQTLETFGYDLDDLKQKTNYNANTYTSNNNVAQPQQTTIEEFDSGNKIENYPNLVNQTVDYSNLNPNPEGPI